MPASQKQAKFRIRSHLAPVVSYTKQLCRTKRDPRYTSPAEEMTEDEKPKSSELLFASVLHGECEACEP